MASYEYTFRALYDVSSYTRLSYEQFDVPQVLTDGEDDDVLEWLVAVTTSDLDGIDYTGFFNVEIDGITVQVIAAETTGIAWIFGNFAGFALPDILAAIPQTWLEAALAGEDLVVCFAPGTLIATPDGERAVETLAIGDMVLTADGRAVPVRWMGRQTVRTRLGTDRVRPVRVRAGALGCGVPHSDLVLTGEHALIVDGLAVNAGALVNGTSILWEPAADMPATITYWHIETEAHDEILANGAPAETFVDYVGRKAFDNHQEYLDLYGCERIIPEMKRPRISCRRQLPSHIATRLDIGTFASDVETDFAAMMDRLAPASA